MRLFLNVPLLRFRKKAPGLVGLFSLVLVSSGCNPVGDLLDNQLGAQPSLGTSQTIILQSGIALNQSSVQVASAQAMAGDEVRITLIGRDASGKRVFQGGESVIIGVIEEGAGYSFGRVGSAVDNGDGTYDAVFVGERAGKPCTIFALVSGKLVETTLPQIRVQPGNLSVTGSSVEITSGLASGTSRAAIMKAGVPGVITIVLRDEFGNQIADGSRLADLSLNNLNVGTSSFSIGALSAVTVSPGAYQATILPQTAGTNNSIMASLSGVGSLNQILNVQVQAGSASQIAVSSGNNQVIPILTTTPSALVVLLRDQYNNLVSGATVEWSISSSGGTFSSQTSISNASGLAEVNLTAGSVASDFTITAQVQGASLSTSFDLTTRPGAGESLAFLDQPSSTVTYSAFSPLVRVGIRDAHGNIVTHGADATKQVSLTLSSGSGSLAGTPSVNAVGGIAIFNDLSLSTSGTGKVLTATASLGVGSRNVVSQSFDVTGSLFSTQWPFDQGSDSSYSFDGSKLELASGAVQLKKVDQTDSSSSDFSSGTHQGTLWNSSRSSLMLSDASGSTNLSEFDASWTPQYSELVGYWNFNGTVGDIADGSSIAGVIGASGVVSGSNLDYVQGKLSQGIHFPGAQTDYISVTPSGELAFTDNYTVAFWMKPEDISSGIVLYPFSRDAVGNNGSVGILGNWSGACGGVDGRVYYVIDSEVKPCSNRFVQNNQWNHVVLTMGSGTAKVYLNGILEGSSTYTGSLAGTETIHLGSRQPVYGAHPFKGTLDELAIWKTVLSQSDVTKIYDRQKAFYSGTFLSRVMDASIDTSWSGFDWMSAVPTSKRFPYGGSTQSETVSDYPGLTANLMSGLLVYYDFEQASFSGADSVLDRSGNGRHGTPNSVTVSPDGVIGNAANVVGAIRMTDIDIQGKDFSVSVWVKRSRVTGSEYFIGGGEGGRDKAMHTGFRYVGGFGIDYYYSTTNVTNSIFDDMGWHHYVIVQTLSNRRVYRDGELVFNTGGGYFQGSPSANYYLGSNGSSGGFVGLIDEFGIWQRALTQAEAIQLYQRVSNRIQFQVTTCSQSNCSDADWKGPDGTNQTYFSELNNTTDPDGSGDPVKGRPNFDFSSDFGFSLTNKRYFRYRVLMESDHSGSECDYGSGGTFCSPELKSVNVAPDHYPTEAVISANTAVSFSGLRSWTETLGSTCSNGIKYSFSRDGTNWYWYDAGTWKVATQTEAAQATPSSALTDTVMGTFGPTVGTGSLRYRAFLTSTGASSCSLNELELDAVH